MIAKRGVTDTYVAPNTLRYFGRVTLADDCEAPEFVTGPCRTHAEALAATDALIAELIDALKGLQSCGK